MSMPKPDDFEPVLYFEGTDSRFPNKRRCTAWARSAGAQCGNPAMTNGKCHMHGGKSPPPGYGHHALKHGRYSRSLPVRLRFDYEAAVSDPQKLSLIGELGLLEIQIHEALQSLGQGQVTANILETLEETYNGLRESALNADEVGLVNGITQLGILVTEAQKALPIYNRLDQLIELKRKVTATEHKRVMDTAQILTYSQAVGELTTLAHDIASSIQRELDVDNARKALIIVSEAIGYRMGQTPAEIAAEGESH